MIRNRKHKKIDTAKMYRHFAIVTVGLTALVGVLADGEAQQAIETELAKQSEQRRLEEADKNSGSREIIRKDPHATGAAGSFGSDSAIGSASMGTATSSSRDFIRLPPGAKPGMEIWERLGLTEAEWFALPSETRKSLAGTNDPMIIGTEEERREAMKKMSEASRSRANPNPGQQPEESDY
ncbi:hypothetical protein [Parerythrobacter aestuarii]|uniref:hypothetical protein n=1 Tax=Parerythrobacter aestuarii TaxID=3020909 RepID=UPI0024DE0C24|nr:hypothetical protein [Parerythrobacter aestuarii]